MSQGPHHYIVGNPAPLQYTTVSNGRWSKHSPDTHVADLEESSWLLALAWSSCDHCSLIVSCRRNMRIYLQTKQFYKESKWGSYTISFISSEVGMDLEKWTYLILRSLALIININFHSRHISKVIYFEGHLLIYLMYT